MSLIVGDIHGNHPKATAFLQYRPEEEHIFVGDYFDSYIASDEEICNTAKLIFESNSIKLFGNHDLMYLPNRHSYMCCSGERNNPTFKLLMGAYKHKLAGAVLRDGYVITHAGVTAAIGNPLATAEELVAWINKEVDAYIFSPVVPESLSKIFNIGSCRGGWQQYGGVFWADYRFEKYDKRLNQVFGHSHTKEMKLMRVGKAPQNRHVCVDAPQFYCFNTETGKFEDFMPEEYKNDENVRNMLEKSY